MSKSLNAKLEDFYPRSPCGERPGCQRPCERPTRDFYPRSPCGERRPHGQKHIYSRAFLSTLSLRRATAGSALWVSGTGISIHALLAESDGEDLRDFLVKQLFLSTLSLRRATAWRGVVHGHDGISIHALLAESDVRRARCTTQYKISIHALLAESDFCNSVTVQLAI